MNIAHWPARNLKELVSFLSHQHHGGVRLRAVSDRMGISLQAISAIMQKDDCNLSWVENLACSYGYELCLEYTLPAFCFGNSGRANASEYFPHAGNLMGFAEYAATRGLTINALAKRLNINYRVVERALETGDVKVSVLLSMAKEFDIQIKWNWKPRDLVA